MVLHDNQLFCNSIIQQAANNFIMWYYIERSACLVKRDYEKQLQVLSQFNLSWVCEQANNQPVVV